MTVLLDPEGAHGASLKYVVEAKDKRESLPSILSELDEAMLNRGASAAVAVFGKPSASPVPVSFQRYGNKAIVVFDKETLDESALQVATLWARWVTLRSAEDQQSLDTAAAAEIVDRVAQSLERITSVRRSHTLAKKNIDEAGKAVDLLQQEVSRGLDELRALISETADPR